jgi:hypothetical protein
MFNPFERMIAFRYLRARKGERFVSVIAIFSLVGIALGVATLIIVMSVMNGFRQELLGRILGLNGHMSIASAQAGNLPDYGPLTERIRTLPGVVSATPLVEGQVLLTSEGGGASGGLARGIRPEDIRVEATGPHDVRLEARVVVLEPLGAETLVTLACEGGELIARLPPNLPFSAGQNTAVWVNMDKCHLFDKDTGMVLRAGD